MEPTDLENRARNAYEVARAKRALLAAAPLVAVGAVGIALAHDKAACGIAAAMFVLGAIFFWRGRGLARGVLPGVAVGVLPFVAMHGAQLYGHACAGSACFSVCIPASAVSGILGGVLIGRFARGTREVTRSWVSAAMFAALTGALACSCVGVGGLVGLVAGLVVGSVPLIARPLLTRA